MKLNITQAAERKLTRLAADRSIFKVGLLKLSVQGGGCSGMSYRMEWVDQYPSPGSWCLPMGTFEVLVDQKSALFLDGVTLDFSDGLDGRGFEFSNPKAKKTCGCGTSFST